MPHYPLNLTREAIAKVTTCPRTIKAFDAVAPSGTLLISDVNEHASLLRGPLAEYEAWLVDEGLLPPIFAADTDGCAVAGWGGIAAVGSYGSATAGEYSMATAGHHGVAVVGDYSAAVVGDYGVATGGQCSMAVAEYRGSATAGDRGTAISGDHGSATAGNCGAAVVGLEGVVSAGRDGVLICFWRDPYAADRLRVAVAYVGEDGIEPDTPYRLDTSTNPPRFVRVEDGEGAGDGFGGGGDA